MKKMTGTHNRKVRKEYLSIMTTRPHSVQTMKPSKSIAAVAPFNNETTSSMDIVDDLQIPDSQIPDLVDSMDTRNGSHSDGICALCFFAFIYFVSAHNKQIFFVSLQTIHMILVRIPLAMPVVMNRMIFFPMNSRKMKSFART